MTMTQEDQAAVAEVRGTLMASMAVTGPAYTHDQYDHGMAALNALAVALAAARAETVFYAELETDQQVERLRAERERLRAEALRYDTALAVLDESTTKIGEEWIEEYRWKTGAYHRILGFRPKIMALAGEFRQMRKALRLCAERACAYGHAVPRTQVKCPCYSCRARAALTAASEAPATGTGE